MEAPFQLRIFKMNLMKCSQVSDTAVRQDGDSHMVFSQTDQCLIR